MGSIRWVVLVAAAVAAEAPAPARGEVGAPGDRRALQDACGRGRADACATLGARALAGDGEPRDDRLVATYLLWACDLGERPACARLAALYADGTGVRRDLVRAASLARAAGQDPARLRGRDGAPPARAALAPLDGADLERQMELVEVYVPGSARAALGLSRDRIASAGLAVPEDRVLIETLVRERLPEISRCVVDAAHETTGVGWISFVLGGDGRPSDVRVDAGGAWPSAADCLRARVTAWEFPLPRRTSGGLVWLEVVGTLPRPAPGAAPRVQARRAPRGTPPSLQDSGCVRDSLFVHPGERLAAPGPAILRFHVDADGNVSELEFLSPVPLGAARALRRAVHDCPWNPAQDAQGRPVSAWAVMPFVLRGE